MMKPTNFKSRPQWLSLVTLFVVISGQAQSGSAVRDVNVADSIEMQRFIGQEGPVVPGQNYSPDHKHVFVVTQRGLVKTNKLEATIWIFQTDSLRKSILTRAPAAAPRAIVTLTGTTTPEDINGAATVIMRPVWQSDGSHITFLGRNGNAAWHVYSVNIYSSRMSQLTPKEQNVHQFAIGRNVLVYSIVLPRRTDRLPGQVVVTGNSLNSILFPDELPRNTLEVWIIRRGCKTAAMRYKSGSTLRYEMDTRFPEQEIFSLSPDDRHLIGSVEVESLPGTWAEYNSNASFLRIPVVTPPGVRYFRLQEYVVIDVDSGLASSFNAPLGRNLGFAYAFHANTGAGVVWYAKGRRVLLVNTFVPLATATETEKAAWIATPQIVDYDIDHNRWSIVAPIKGSAEEDRPSWSLLDLELDGKRKEVTLHYSDSLHPDEMYRENRNVWTAVADNRMPKNIDDEPGQLELIIHQSLNNPPTLFASVKPVETARQIWSPNPQFHNINLGEAKAYDWQDDEGHKVRGVLFLPLHYIQGKRYPLVIEPRSYSQDQFIIDGTYSTAVAARAMAAAGLAVLEAGEPEIGNHDREWRKHNLEYALNGYRAGIRKLNAEGVIDPKNVGIVGF
jgi:dipeptidyl aminopeptidase/acylaminoacyl peptidase